MFSAIPLSLNPIQNVERQWKIAHPTPWPNFVKWLPQQKKHDLIKPYDFYVDILQLWAKFQTVTVSCSRFIRITNSSDHSRVWTANLLHKKYLPNPLGHMARACFVRAYFTLKKKKNGVEDRIWIEVWKREFQQKSILILPNNFLFLSSNFKSTIIGEVLTFFLLKIQLVANS